MRTYIFTDNQSFSLIIEHNRKSLDVFKAIKGYKF